MSVERAAASTSRPVDASAPMVVLRSRERVSRDSEPAPRTSVERDVVKTTIAPNTTAAITTMAITNPVLISLRSLILCLYVECHCVIESSITTRRKFRPAMGR